MVATPTPRASTAQRRQEIVEAVLRLACYASPDGITTQAIADEIGITQGGLFRHFASKDEIQAATIAWVRERFLAVLDEATEGIDAPLERLEAMFMAHIRFVAERPAVPRLIFHELQRPAESPLRAEVRAILEAYRSRVMQSLKAAQATGRIDRQVDLQSAVVLYVGMVQGLVMQAAIADGPAQLESRAAGVFRLYLRALGVRP
ncbi:MAG: TetR/AcrR family transcriptional regulator [Rhodocyclaceae bacterium]|nr:TetR/AcrR family transcriptional regulator [Rhodocyclaceae bacterium]